MPTPHHLIHSFQAKSEATPRSDIRGIAEPSFVFSPGAIKRYIRTCIKAGTKNLLLKHDPVVDRDDQSHGEGRN